MLDKILNSYSTIMNTFYIFNSTFVQRFHEYESNQIDGKELEIGQQKELFNPKLIVMGKGITSSHTFYGIVVTIIDIIWCEVIV